MQIIREGQKLSYLITAAMMTSLLGGKFDKAQVAFASASSNGNSIAAEQSATEDGIRLDITARQEGYAAVTTVASRVSDGLAVAVFGEQFFVISNEHASQVVPRAGSLQPEQEATKAAATETSAETSAAAAGGGKADKAVTK